MHRSLGLFGLLRHIPVKMQGSTRAKERNSSDYVGSFKTQLRDLSTLYVPLEAVLLQLNNLERKLSRAMALGMRPPTRTVRPLIRQISSSKPRLSLRPRTRTEELRKILHPSLSLQERLQLLLEAEATLPQPKVPQDNNWIKCPATYALVNACCSHFAPINCFAKVRRLILALTEDARQPLYASLKFLTSALRRHIKDTSIAFVRQTQELLGRS